MHQSPNPAAGAASASGADGSERSRSGRLRQIIARVAHRLAGERGAATAEYAVATMAAVGFAGLLVVILRGDEVRGILTDLVRNALTVG
jgi:hypothetical protein